MLIGPRRRSPYRRALEAPCSPWWKCRRPRAWGLRGELKARGGGDAGTSSTTSNAEIAPQPPCAQRVPAARGHLQRWRSSTMSPHRLRRAALHLPTRRSERGLLYFHHGLLGIERHQESEGNHFGSCPLSQDDIVHASLDPHRNLFS